MRVKIPSGRIGFLKIIDRDLSALRFLTIEHLKVGQN